MKQFIIPGLVLTALYHTFFASASSIQSGPTSYVKARVNTFASGSEVSIVGVWEVPGKPMQCEAYAPLEKVKKTCQSGKCDITEISCLQELPKQYKQMFQQKQMSSHYLFGESRHARFVGTAWGLTKSQSRYMCTQVESLFGLREMTDTLCI